MGSYLNPGSDLFQMALQSQIFVDKSGLIQVINQYINTLQRFVCVSRPRRFGKSMAADMLAAYYDREHDAHLLFKDLAIGTASTYQKHLNQYDVIKIDMQEFLSATDSVEEMIRLLQDRLVQELHRKYPEYVSGSHLIFAMKDIYAATKRPFVILIDEWDCLFREYEQDGDAQKKYLDFLRAWLKDKDYVALAYMTGILPIKKYGSHSALNMFMEYSMTDPGCLAEYFGFTEAEVRNLCERYQMDFEEAREWYDGYHLVEHDMQGSHRYSMYSPKSVVEAMMRHKFGTYWNQTETYEALKVYIQMNMDGLKDAVVEMFAGGTIPINTGTFSNDMTTFATKDDVLTLLVHLGYLNYDSETETVCIPNKEVSKEYRNAIRTMQWQEIIHSVEASYQLLESLWMQDESAVARGIETAHAEFSVLQYNDENALSCAINLAFYAAREYYTLIRELPSGKGFADICFLPKKKHLDKPAVIVELKWNKDAQGAIAQIKNRQYIDALNDYKGNVLLVGINYDRKTKKHACVIERQQGV